MINEKYDLIKKYFNIYFKKYIKMMIYWIDLYFMI
jgi:hypothetical protein